MTPKENKSGKAASADVTTAGPADTSSVRTVYLYSGDKGKPLPLMPAAAFIPLAVNKQTAERQRVIAKALSHEERLSISQCETLLGSEDCSSLTHNSPLNDWMDAWDRAGILESVMTATLGDIALAEKTLAAHHLCLAAEPVRSWPVWGLRSMLEEQRLDLNRHARAGTPYRGLVSCSRSIAQCSKLGTEAPLIEWIRVWQSTRTRNAVFASLAGVGHCYIPNSISQCEMDESAEADHIYRIALFSPYLRRSLSQVYVLSGYLRNSHGQLAYAYHPLTRDQIPSIDASNWISGNRLSLTYETDGSHPFSLIKRSSGRKLADLDGWHVMGLQIKKEPSSNQERKPAHVFDVLTADDFALIGSEVSDIKSPSSESRAMPGVYPKTWLVDCGASSEERIKGYSVAMCRKVDSYELIVNNWLLRVACMSHLPLHRQHSSFRTAKFDTDAVKNLMHPANDFALMHATSSYGGMKPFSTFRMPLGSLISSGITLQGFTESSHHVCADSAHEGLIASLSECLAAPRMDLDYLLHWMVFDSLTGFLAQMPYRYQVIYINAGLSLSPIPFWSLRDDETVRENVSSDFGYRIVFGADEAATYLSGDSLSRLAKVAGLEPSPLLRFRSLCLDKLLLSADGLIDKLTDHAESRGELDTDQFRNAKCKIEWIKART